MKNNRSCYNCKAYEECSCCLGYEQDKGIPLEKCPKPLSTKKLHELIVNK